MTLIARPGGHRIFQLIKPYVCISLNRMVPFATDSWRLNVLGMPMAVKRSF